MIARIWHGWTGADRADEVASHLRETTLERFAAMPGNVSAVVLQRPVAGGVELMTFSVWDSPDCTPAGVDENHPLFVARETIASTWEIVVGAEPVRPALAEPRAA